MKTYDTLRNKNILITGNTGFKGSWLTFYLKHLNCSVWGLANKDYNGIYELSNTKKLLNKQYYLDIGKASVNEISDIINEINPDIIFHFAAQSLVSLSNKDPIETIEINSLGTLKLLEAAKFSSNLEVITIATTDKVYANPSNPNKEVDRLFGSEFYSASKVAAENFINAFIKKNIKINFNIATIRSGNVIGGGDRGKNRIVPDIINAIFENDNLVLRNPEHIRPWTYVLDSLYGYLLATEYCIKNNVNEIFNLNSKVNNKYDVQFVLKEFLKIQDFNYEISKLNNDVNVKEVETLIIDSEKALKLLNWQAKYNIQKIIECVYSWELNYKKNRGVDYSLKEVENYINYAI